MQAALPPGFTFSAEMCCRCEASQPSHIAMGAKHMRILRVLSASFSHHLAHDLPFSCVPKGDSRKARGLLGCAKPCQPAFSAARALIPSGSAQKQSASSCCDSPRSYLLLVRYCCR